MVSFARDILCGTHQTPSDSTAPNQIEELIAYFTPQITIPLVKVCDAQTKLLDQALLPKLNGENIWNGKVDFVVQLDPEHLLLQDALQLGRRIWG